jgi:hypothetical protein
MCCVLSLLLLLLHPVLCELQLRKCSVLSLLLLLLLHPWLCVLQLQ